MKKTRQNLLYLEKMTSRKATIDDQSMTHQTCQNQVLIQWQVQRTMHARFIKIAETLNHHFIVSECHVLQKKS
ncbi:MAG: hypothetical protein OXE77_00230 [Flavobacteriaceae bacterium]|nr:hypothetical protein [Flavobacteriaceae bacterium]MCY4267349.1 hypothetical protein [Flavobacteriaceae bacterium]